MKTNKNVMLPFNQNPFNMVLNNGGASMAEWLRHQFTSHSLKHWPLTKTAASRFETTRPSPLGFESHER